jgi:hypothetical protein
MWPFRKKTQTLDQLPINGPWTIAEGENNGRVLILRWNEGYRSLRPVPGYEHQVGIAVPLTAPEQTGLPSVAEDAELGQIEDLVCDRLQDHAQSLLVAVITTDGMREFVFYTRDPEHVKGCLEQLRKDIPSHEVQMIVQVDKEWRVYGQLSSAG